MSPYCCFFAPRRHQRPTDRKKNTQQQQSRVPITINTEAQTGNTPGVIGGGSVVVVVELLSDDSVLGVGVGDEDG